MTAALAVAIDLVRYFDLLDRMGVNQADIVLAATRSSVRRLKILLRGHRSDHPVEERLHLRIGLRIWLERRRQLPRPALRRVLDDPRHLDLCGLCWLAGALAAVSVGDDHGGYVVTSLIPINYIFEERRRSAPELYDASLQSTGIRLPLNQCCRRAFAGR